MPDSPYSDFVFDKYCTLRNYIRKANLINSLYAVWAHVSYLQFRNFSLPSMIKNAPLLYQNNKSREICIKYGVFEWELEIIARELLIHGSLFQYTKDFCDWNHLAGALNKLKSIENDIAGHFINNTNILLEFKRISHRQFPWQTIPNTQKMVRYWQIFSQLDDYFEEVYGIQFTHFYVICLALFGVFSKRFMLDYPPQFDLGIVNQTTLDRVLRFIATDYNTLSSNLRNELSMFHDYVYKYHSLTAHPLVIIDYRGQKKLICPLPTFLFNRVTDGIYYDMINDRNDRADEIRNKIGDAFQSYIGDFIQRSTQGCVDLIPESRYGSSHHPKDTVDWFILDSNQDAIFVECKAKRLTISAKSELDDEGALDKDLKVLAKAVKQSYKSLIDYQNNEYPTNYPESRKQYLMICTLEEWYIFGNIINEKLLGLVRKELESSNISLDILDSNPYFIASASSVERIAGILRENTIEELLAGFLQDEELRTWHIDTYISNNYSEENFINPFETEFDNFVENELIAVCRSE